MFSLNQCHWCFKEALPFLGIKIHWPHLYCSIVNISEIECHLFAIYHNPVLWWLKATYQHNSELWFSIGNKWEGMSYCIFVNLLSKSIHRESSLYIFCHFCCHVFWQYNHQWIISFCFYDVFCITNVPFLCLCMY